ncbi:hypothetical protein M758_1G243800 [Ceratodon purpureus]|nr:hypothetical protein M758_1G243800 [Ceratodon purpureus]
MNLPSASCITRCVKSSQCRGSSSDLVPDYHVSRNSGYYQSNKNVESPEIMASDYSDAGDTFASRPSNAADEDHDAVSSGPHGNTECHNDVASRDFILKRFLPAAKAMSAADKKSSAPKSSLPSEHRSASLPKYSSSVRTSRPGSFESASSRSKSRFIHEVKQDVSGFSNDEDEERFSACGFPLHLGRLTLLQFRYSFRTSRSRSRGRAPQMTKVSKEVIQDEVSDNSDDLFWSDEEVFEDAVSLSGKASVNSMNERESMTSSEMKKRLVAEILAPPARSHSMETVHTPDHRGFLGVPKMSNLSSGEMERARQVDRLGARLTRMLSKTNYMESRNVRVHDDHQNECKVGESSHKSSGTTNLPSSAEVQKTKWVDALASLRPPPSPKMPSESWLSNTLPPERFLMVKKLSRKPLGSFIPIKPPVKPTTSEEDSSPRPRQPCSSKDHLPGRQIQSPTLQAH